MSSANSPTGCPRSACDHTASMHDGLFSSACQADNCPCGESRVMDGRAAAVRRGEGGWIESDNSGRTIRVEAS